MEPKKYAKPRPDQLIVRSVDLRSEPVRHRYNAAAFQDLTQYLGWSGLSTTPASSPVVNAALDLMGAFNSPGCSRAMTGTSSPGAEELNAPGC